MTGKTEKLNTVTGEELLSTPLRSPGFIVDTLLGQGLHILAGSPKVGKSWLALWLAVTVAKGEAVWNMESKQGTTLYLCLEDSLAEGALRRCVLPHLRHHGHQRGSGYKPDPG